MPEQGPPQLIEHTVRISALISIEIRMHIGMSSQIDTSQNSHCTDVQFSDCVLTMITMILSL